MSGVLPEGAAGNGVETRRPAGSQPGTGEYRAGAHYQTGRVQRGR